MEEDYSDVVEKVVEVKTLTSKQIKKLAKPEFAANPEKFYPVETLKKWGFHRAQCPKCNEHFWRYSEKRQVCGDSRCEGRYHFIGKGTGKGKESKITYAQAWNGFKKSFESAKIPHTAIKRYPVVARWRADVDYVAAGIFCFQPYCVTGELDPPANPLICPQFCLRFNDLDSIGLSGRHFSGFVMLGIQVFNKPDNFVYFKEECVDFNLRWLIEELGIDREEITLIEDVWAGGGNLGPSIEYFIGGLELGNMVFMQYKTFPDGSRQELEVKVIDVGIGLERVPWLLNGSPTSYMDVFPTALQFMQDKLGIGFTNKLWNLFGPYSCLLNIDEVEDLDATWEYVSSQCGVKKAELVEAITPVKDMYIVCDHTRSVLVAITDGSLPSNSGGSANLRNILRRALSILHKNNWWEKLGGLEGFLHLFECHRRDLSEIYGAFPEYKSFTSIIEMEYQRWSTRDQESTQKLKNLVSKRKGQLTVEDWMWAMNVLGLDPDKISEITSLPIPGTLYLAIAEKQETTARAPLRQLYDTARFSTTEELFYTNAYTFQGKLLAVLENIEDHNKKNIVVLDKTCFYPTSGGQEHDCGYLEINGVKYEVKDVQKAGKAILHYLDKEVKEAENVAVEGHVDPQRRSILRNHHTATHIMYASAKKILGPHVWQHGAKKTPKYAHLDITHFRALSQEEELAIEAEANRIVFSSTPITKYNLPKEEAELKYGFSLYQGGAVPGNSLRVVDIAGIDQEACCGTHCENTSQVGLIKIIHSSRISDGTVRLTYVAGDLALEQVAQQSRILNTLQEEWKVTRKDVISTADRFFDGYKKFGTKVKKQALQIDQLTMSLFILDEKRKKLLIVSDEPTPTQYISVLPQFVTKLKEGKKSVIVMGANWIYGIYGDASQFEEEKFKQVLEESRTFVSRSQKNKKAGEKAEEEEEEKKKEMPLIVKKQMNVKQGKQKVSVTDVVELMGSVPQLLPVMNYIKSLGFEEEPLLKD